MSDEELGLTNILAKEKRPGTFLEKIDPEELEQEVKKIMESYRTLKLSEQ